MANVAHNLSAFELGGLLGDLDGPAAPAATPDAGTAPAAGAGNGTGAEPRLFNEQQVNAMIQKSNRDANAKVKQLETSQQEAANRLQELEGLILEAAEEEGIDLENINDLVAPSTGDAGAPGIVPGSFADKFRHVDPNTAKMVSIMEKRHSRERTEMEQRIHELETKNNEAEKHNFETGKKLAVAAALQKAGCEDDMAGLKYFYDDVFKDESDGRWYVKDPKDPNRLEMLLEEGIKEYLPPSLQKTKISGQGGGTSGSRHVPGLIVQKEQELVTLEKAARLNPADTGKLAQYRKAKRELETLKAGRTPA